MKDKKKEENKKREQKEYCAQRKIYNKL